MRLRHWTQILTANAPFQISIYVIAILKRPYYQSIVDREFLSVAAPGFSELRMQRLQQTVELAEDELHQLLAIFDLHSVRK